MISRTIRSENVGLRMTDGWASSTVNVLILVLGGEEPYKTLHRVFCE